jgi:hypothetical protein
LGEEGVDSRCELVMELEEEAVSGIRVDRDARVREESSQQV